MCILKSNIVVAIVKHPIKIEKINNFFLPCKGLEELRASAGFRRRCILVVRLC